MSRRQDLMDKPLTHRTLGELVAEFESSYKRYQHTLKKVRQGRKEGGKESVSGKSVKVCLNVSSASVR